MIKTSNIVTYFYSLLDTLDDVSSSVVLENGEEYQTTTSTLSVIVVKANESSKNYKL